MHTGNDEQVMMQIRAGNVALLLSRFQEMKYEEIAAVFDCSVGAVKVMAHRAINDLRQAYLDAQGGTS